MVTNLSVKEIAGTADTAVQGDVVFQALDRALANSDDIVLSFEGIQTATSSFANIAFVKLLDRYSFDLIKDRLRVVRSTRQINEMIKSRLEREAGGTPADQAARRASR